MVPLVLLGLFGGSLVLGCDGDSSPTLGYEGGSFNIKVTSTGFPRRAVVHVPEDLPTDRPVPLLLVFHGTGGSGLAMQIVTELDDPAAAKGMVVAYPDALDGRWTVDRSETLDLIFAADLIDAIEREIDIDRSSIYASGFSRGALFSMKMACERPDLLSAIAPVGAPVQTALIGDCDPGKPMPAVFFMGTRDQFFPWEGSANEADTVHGGPGTGRWWAELNGCDTDPAVTELPDLADDGTTVERWVYPGCPSGGSVEFFAIDGGEHTWPGSPVDQGFLGVVSRDIVASEILVEFLANH
jgi:polyhydroxybutyrate depolymerase